MQYFLRGSSVMAWISAVIDFSLTAPKENVHAIRFPSVRANNGKMGRRLVYLFRVCSSFPVGNSLQRSVID